MDNTPCNRGRGPGAVRSYSVSRGSAKYASAQLTGNNRLHSSMVSGDGGP